MRRIGSSCFARALNGQATAVAKERDELAPSHHLPQGAQDKSTFGFKLAHGSRTMNANPKMEDRSIARIISASRRWIRCPCSSSPIPRLGSSSAQRIRELAAASQPWEDH